MGLRGFGLGMALLALIGAASAVEAADKTLRVVPHADLKVLDPHTNTATITIMHGAMIYDTLFAWDLKLRPQPQMVGAYQVSADRLAHTYTLRPGLKFHDGQPVTTKDVIPSIKRWMVRNTLGQALAKFIDKIEATDDKTFVIRLKEPFAFVEFALGSLMPHHARRGCCDRPVQSGDDDDRLGAVPLCPRGMEPRRQGRL